MRVHLTATTKMWLLTSLAFFYVIIQYHVSNTWPLPTTGNDLQESEMDTQRRIWLKRIVGDSKLAEEIQNMIGEKVTQDLAYRINRQLLSHSCIFHENESLFNLPVIYIVTPTYRRPEQLAELTRMSQTLMHVQNIYWLLIEDAKEKSQMISNFLNRTGIRFIHLHCKYEFSAEHSFLFYFIKYQLIQKLE